MSNVDGQSFHDDDYTKLTARIGSFIRPGWSCARRSSEWISSATSCTRLPSVDTVMSAISAYKLRPPVHQRLERLLRIGIVEQRPMAGVPSSLDLLIHGGLQIDDGAALVEYAAVVRVDHGTAPGREHDVLHLREAIDRLLFTQAETGLTFLFEDERDVDAGLRLDVRVAIVEAEPEQPGELTADRGFSGSHRPDQKNIALGDHGGRRS
jgi:hypothetical protein